MKCLIQNPEYEEKMDQISEYLEELILDAYLGVLRKIKDRNMLFNEVSNRSKTDQGLF